MNYFFSHSADPQQGNALPSAESTATPSSTTATTVTSTTLPTSGSGGTGGATALFPCLVYYPGSQNYSLIWVPMDGSNPIVSGANILSGSGALNIPTQV